MVFENKAKQRIDKTLSEVDCKLSSIDLELLKTTLLRDMLYANHEGFKEGFEMAQDHTLKTLKLFNL